MGHQLHEVDSNASKRKCSLRNLLGAEPVKGSADFGRQVAHLGVGSDGLHPTRMETAQHHLSGRPSILGSHITLNLPVTTPVRDGKQLHGHGRKVEDALHASHFWQDDQGEVAADHIIDWAKRQGWIG